MHFSRIFSVGLHDAPKILETFRPLNELDNSMLHSRCERPVTNWALGEFVGLGDRRSIQDILRWIDEALERINHVDKKKLGPFDQMDYKSAYLKRAKGIVDEARSCCQRSEES